MPVWVEIGLVEASSAVIHENSDGFARKGFENEVRVGVAIYVASDQAIADHGREHEEGIWLSGAET